jgi:hypothetical protein
MRHRLQSQAPGARAGGSPGHLSSAQGASRSSIVGRLLSDVATTAEPSIVESALGSACGGCAGGADEPGDMPDHGRTREPGDDCAEVSAVNQVGDAQSSVLRGAQTISLSVACPGRLRAAVAPTSSIRSPSRTYEALAVTHRYSSPGIEWSRRCSSLPMSTVQKIVSPACASCGTRSRRIVKAAGPPDTIEGSQTATPSGSFQEKSTPLYKPRTSTKRRVGDVTASLFLGGRVPRRACTAVPRCALQEFRRQRAVSSCFPRVGLSIRRGPLRIIGMRPQQDVVRLCESGHPQPIPVP